MFLIISFIAIIILVPIVIFGHDYKNKYDFLTLTESTTVCRKKKSGKKYFFVFIKNNLEKTAWHLYPACIINGSPIVYDNIGEVQSEKILTEHEFPFYSCMLMLEQLYRNSSVESSKKHIVSTKDRKWLEVL